MGFEPIYESDHKLDFYFLDDGYNELVSVKYPTSIIIAPFVFIIFFILALFADELEPFNRKYLKKKIKDWFKK
jgi:hypothetical protein